MKEQDAEFLLTQSKHMFEITFLALEKLNPGLKLEISVPVKGTRRRKRIKIDVNKIGRELISRIDDFLDNKDRILIEEIKEQ